MLEKILRIFMLAVLVITTAACQQTGTSPSVERTALSPAIASTGTATAVVNGEKAPKSLLEAHARRQGLDLAVPEQRERALEQLIDQILLAQDAIANGALGRPEVQIDLASVRLLTLSSQRLKELRESVEVTEAELKAYYEQEAARVGGDEWHLQHVLFDNETAALAAAGKALQPNADFNALIAEYSAGGALQARDLGWANRAQLPDELSEAATSLQDGQVAPVPIKTRFGWHVLKRVASRPLQPPPFEQVREGVRKQLVERAVADKVRALREAAKIEQAEVSATSRASSG